MVPEDIVRTVLERVHASDPSVSALYAEDAVRYGHDGWVQQGRAAIAEFYESLFPTSPPYPEVDGMFVHPPFVGALMRLPEPHQGQGRVINLFEIVDGSIRSLRVLLEQPSPPDVA
jgi:hypothetical protein